MEINDKYKRRIQIRSRYIKGKELYDELMKNNVIKSLLNGELDYILIKDYDGKLTLPDHLSRGYITNIGYNSKTEVSYCDVVFYECEMNDFILKHIDQYNTYITPSIIDYNGVLSLVPIFSFVFLWVITNERIGDASINE